MASKLIARLLAPHRAYMRRLDLLILWPSCKQEAQARGLGLDAARKAFGMHARRDSAWKVLGHDEISRRIERLS